MTTLQVPIEIDESFKTEIQEIVKDSVSELFKDLLLVKDLPAYPNQRELMKSLKIGKDKISTWIDNGLPVIDFGHEKRFDRNDIIDYLNGMKS